MGTVVRRLGVRWIGTWQRAGYAVQMVAGLAAGSIAAVTAFRQAIDSE